jgi:hypothetical protein
MKRLHPRIFDREATAAAGFLDPRSYIRKGKRFVFGEDMKALRIYVFTRSHGFCEQKLRGVLHGRCQRNISWETMELDHQPSLAQGGDDSPEGTVASCRRCHVARHGRVIRSDRKEHRESA